MNGVQYLVSSGHRLDDIKNYTIDLFNAFLKSAAIHERGDLRDMFVIFRSAQHADKNGAAKVLKELSHER